MIALHHGDSRDIVPALSALVDAVITDPPYSLVSIQKRFGKPGSAPVKIKPFPGQTGSPHARAARGFMGQQWDTGEVAHDPKFWAAVYAQMKPGAHLVAFGGTRTHHRMVCAIEDAGFDIRDTIAWLYGTGFPKSHNVGKGIDKAAGAEREVLVEGPTVRRIRPGADQNGDGTWEKLTDRTYTHTVTSPATEAAAQWDGWGTALKPAFEPIVLARKPLDGTIAANVLKFGTGAINIDGCRIDPGSSVMGGGNNFDAWRTGEDRSDRPAIHAQPTEGHNLGRWPANVTHDGSDEVLAAFPDSAGQLFTVGPQHGARDSVNCYGDYGSRPLTPPRGDSGSAARFFFSAKAGRDDRWGSKHPTVKPLALMRWLCRLVTPPGGTILDPFAGSGSTGIAALAEGFDAILVERDDTYVADIRERIAFYEGSGRHSTATKNRNVTTPKGGEDMPLFAGEIPMIHVDHNWERFREPWRRLGPVMAEETRRVANSKSYGPPWWDLLHSARISKGITTKEAAAAIGKPVDKLYGVERGEVKLPYEAVVLLAALYQIPIERLAGAVSREAQP